jgi:plastocyanin
MISFPMNRTAGALFSLLVSAGLAVAAGEASAASNVHRIVVGEMKYAPAVHALRAGDRVLWVNNGVLRHTATARDKSFNVDLPPKTSRTTIIRSPGTIAYYCVFHPAMKGVLKVAK